MSHLIDETCCKQRCCNKYDEYRKQLERIADRINKEIDETKDILSEPLPERNREYFFNRQCILEWFMRIINGKA